ncbi:MAG: Flp family type IVb pilin [Bdellovibrionales bacterium]|nr:Flp family type IVb pilin [Bdellovibrionales bacterium]
MEKEVSKQRKQLGATLIEYALLVALIAIVCIAAITFMGTQISTKMSGTAGQL